MPRTRPFGNSRGFTPIERLDLAKTRQAAGERPTRGSQMTQGDRNAMLIRWASSRGWRDDEPLSDFVRREQRREREQTT